jgi:hypothetical protein
LERLNTLYKEKADPPYGSYTCITERICKLLTGQARNCFLSLMYGKNKIMLQEQIREQMKTALKEKGEIRLSVLRGLISAFTNELVATKRKPDEVLSDEEVLKVITRQVKQRKDSIDQFERGSRADLAAKERAELEILEVYLPEMMSREEIEKTAHAKKEELGIDDPSKKGMLMGAVMKELQGKADGGEVKNVIDSLFS